MKILSTIWHDIRSGDYIDVYITILAVFTLGILNILGEAPADWLNSVILGALGVLGISALRSAHHFQQITSMMSSSRQLFQNIFPDSLHADLVASEELWFVGVSLTRTIKTYYADLENHLREGHLIKVLLVHPDGAAVEMAESRVYGRSNVARAKADIHAVLEDLCRLKIIATEKMLIRTIQNPLTFGAVAVNPESLHGALYLEHYSYQMTGGSVPKFVLREAYDEWYGFFRDEMRNLWAHGADWEGEQAVS
jgi:hypothetical protein